MLAAASALPSLSQLTSRLDPQAALRAQAEKWTKIAEYFARRGDRPAERKALALAEGYRREHGWRRALEYVQAARPALAAEG